MSVSNNADDYATQRQGIYFPGNPWTLTGQCVSLVKWFLAEMCSVPDPQAARGNAKDFGDTLVRQGHAVQVPADQRRRGDIVVWKQDGGGYGHIGVLLSGDRVFEENVGLKSSASTVITVKNNRGEVIQRITVYASRIDPLVQSWRLGPPTYYRVKSYTEHVPAPAPSPSANTGLRPAKGTATVLVSTLNVRTAPATNAGVVAQYKQGETFKYDGWCVGSGFVWLSYVGASGIRRYVAEGPNDGREDTVYVRGGV